MPQAFGGNKDNSLSLKVNTTGDLKAALKKAVATTDKLIMLEVMTDKHDIPPLLAEVSAALK